MEETVKARLCVVLCGLSIALTARASELFVNGGFEANAGRGSTAFTSWLTGGTAASDDNFYADNSANDSTPVNGNPTVGPFAGTWYGVSDMSGLQSPESSYIVQLVTIPLGTTSVIFSGEMFVNDIFGGSGSGAEIGIWAAAANVLTTAPLFVIQAFVDTATAGGPNPYVLYTLDVTAQVTAGSSYQFGVLEEDETGPINVGVDNFSLAATGSLATPEPATLIPTALLGAGIILFSLRRKVRGQV
jgi:PEP-CTERM motif